MKNTGLMLSHNYSPAELAGGFICVNSTLESVNVPGVFACGDCCHIVDNPKPKAGVFAVRAGYVFNICVLISEK